MTVYNGMTPIRLAPSGKAMLFRNEDNLEAFLPIDHITMFYGDEEVKMDKLKKDKPVRIECGDFLANKFELVAVHNCIIKKKSSNDMGESIWVEVGDKSEWLAMGCVSEIIPDGDKNTIVMLKDSAEFKKLPYEALD